MAIYKKIILTDDDGSLTNATAVVLGDSTSVYGIRKESDGTVIVADSTAVTNSSTGVYVYDVSALAVGVSYEISWRVTYGGIVQYQTETFTIEADDILDERMTITQADDKVIKLINFYSISGNVIEATDPNSLDYRLRFRTLYDSCQKLIATTVKKIRKIKNISQNPISNQLSGDMFEVVQHLNTDLVYSASSSKAYSFKVDNISTIYIEEETSTDVWTVLTTINHLKPTMEFCEYKGLITPSVATNDIRIRFGGLYPYNIKDIALFAYTFPNADAIPQYEKYNIYTMPGNFYALNKIIFKSSTIDYYWKNNRTLAVSYDYVGEIIINYSVYPDTIDDNSSGSYKFEVSPEAAEVIPYYVASMIMMHDNPSIGDKLFAIYQGMLANVEDIQPSGSTSISNTLFCSQNAKLF